MNDRSSSAGACAAVAVALLLLLLVGGGAAFVFMRTMVVRQQMELEMMARLEADRARSAEVAARRLIEAQANVQASSASATATSQDPGSAPAGTQAGGAQAGGAEAGGAEAAKTPSAAELTSQITSVLQQQAAAWNAGDIPAFMDHYWKSDELTFSSGGKITRGWSATLARYQERYPTPEKMGKLRFEQLEVRQLGERAALVLGQWHVEREPEPLAGTFSLIVRQLEGRWRIIHDHTSRLEE